MAGLKLFFYRVDVKKCKQHLSITPKLKLAHCQRLRHSCSLQNNEHKTDLMAFADKRTLHLAIYMSENIVIVNIFS